MDQVDRGAPLVRGQMTRCSCQVDEDGNGWIDWENFVQLYIRCQKDKTGKEPTRLYNLIEFMICDKDGGGTMSEDECMEILYHRFGKEVMKDMTDKLFKRQTVDGQSIEFAYSEFLTLVDGLLTGNAPGQKNHPPQGSQSARGQPRK